MNLIILFPHVLWQTKMSFVRREVIRELVRRGAHLSGQGWPDYRDDETLQQNIDRMGGDVVFAYKPLGGKGFPALRNCRDIRQPLILSYNEMWDVPWTTSEILESGCKLAICHHENDIPRYNHVTGCRFVHIPHCANPDLFLKHAKPWAERDIDCLLTGVLSPQIYPLRERFARLIRENKIPGVIHPHPGYRLRNVEECDRQAEEYAKLLGRAKVSLCCTSKYRYLLAKHVESAMAGCCVVSDQPEQPASLFLTVNPAESDEQIAAMIRHALRMSEVYGESHQRAAVERFTTSHYCDEFDRACQRAVTERERVERDKD